MHYIKMFSYICRNENGKVMRKTIAPRENRLRREVNHSTRRKLWMKESQQVCVIRLFWYPMEKLSRKETIDYPLND